MKLNAVYDYDAITFMDILYEEYGNESIDMFLCDFPYTFKGKNRVTANRWDLPIDDKLVFDKAIKMLTPAGVIAMTASNPFASYLVMRHLDYFKYEWVWEKDNGSNFVHVNHQPFKVHELVLIFGKAPTTYNKSEVYMCYNPQMVAGVPYKINRKGMTDNLAVSGGYERTSGEYGAVRFPRSVQKFNCEKGLHPTQKPTKLFQYLIETYTPTPDNNFGFNAVVVDVCCGSGTTAIAANNCGRDFIVNDSGCNKSGVKYSQITLDRLAKMKRQVSGND